jgi:hypothetical protein
MSTQDTANNIPVDLLSEGQRNLLRDSRTPPAGIASFHFHDCVGQFRIGSFRTRQVPTSGGKQQAEFSFDQQVVEMQQSGLLQNDGGMERVYGAEERVHKPALMPVWQFVMDRLSGFPTRRPRRRCFVSNELFAFSAGARWPHHSSCVAVPRSSNVCRHHLHGD